MAEESDSEASGRKIRRELRRLLRRAKDATRESTTLQKQRNTFNQFFFSQEGFTSAASEASLSSLLLHHVLERRTGSCVGLAQVYLILARKLGFPVHGMATPLHVFVRWKKGDQWVNVELLEGGRELSDDEYRARVYGVPIAADHPLPLQELTAYKLAARIYNNRGVIYSREGRPQVAIGDYAQAMELDPQFAAPHYNRGLEYLNLQRPQTALADFDAALKLYPSDAWAHNNKGLAHLKLGLLNQAEDDFRKALSLDPGLPAARRNLDLLLLATQKEKENPNSLQPSTRPVEIPQGEALSLRP